MQLDLAFQIFAIIVLIFSVILHEVAHGYAARLLGDPTAKLAGRLTLNPLAHIDPIGSVLIPAFLVLSNSGILFGWAKPVPYNPYNLRDQRWGEAIVGVAGVATNLLVAVLFAGIARVASGAGMVEFAYLAAIVVMLNLSLGLFNLIPIPPLDGFTVLRGILPHRLALPLRDLEDRLQAGGILTFIVVLFILTQFLSEPFYQLVQFFFRLLLGA
jgi:Zn-dependent protease